MNKLKIKIKPSILQKHHHVPLLNLTQDKKTKKKKTTKMKNPYAHLQKLKRVYKALLCALPIVTYNPFNLQPLHTPFDVHQNSLYINFQLNASQVDLLTNYLQNYNPFMQLKKIKIFDTTDYFLSLNIYNCSSPSMMFSTEENRTRFEINTYVHDGTVILNYGSSQLSMDPVNIFKKQAKHIYFNKLLSDPTILQTNCSFYIQEDNDDDDNNKVKLSGTFQFDKNKEVSDSWSLLSEIIHHTGNIYYTNGIMDKVYYDESLINSKINIGQVLNHFVFSYRNMTFSEENIHSVFCFPNQLNFVSSIWHNLYEFNGSNN